MRKILITAMMASVLAGCASSGNQQLKNETEISVQSKLQEGKTTKNEVKSYFGSPDAVSYTDSGNEIWKYAFAKVKVNGTTFIPFYGLFHNGTNGTKKELTILFNDDTIKKYTMSETQINSKSGWAD
ncbi:outer membrane protein assembly factor BamE [Escherichia coli]|uniref:outer membrane protein assembly factor BamE n=1 Tax=Escherichia coli TaxID=562 RepID=UPI000E216828|nr:outer membrane protein assembly factor BamE [Escherichia coli]EHG5981116.1 outer membrane protein assembly factor BamE [Escherichia fergusonii]EES5480981.1 outer membrane protein assembly factor BamE [Escherichia coli]EHG5991274.1 outer membrane protein assembly factor BamE [Escherichia fergusonii]EIE8753128.1 outer membrane protein assembly factor BamE [Escherichia coli]ELD0663007.1 outer membrane protein assembly factor BamE [Escherichia coli]